MRFDKESMERSVREIKSDVESGELTATTWLWILGGGLLGLLASCVKLTEKGTKPILANFSRMTKNSGGTK